MKIQKDRLDLLRLQLEAARDETELQRKETDFLKWKRACDDYKKTLVMAMGERQKLQQDYASTLA